MLHKQTVMVIDDDEIHLYNVKGLLSSDLIEVITYKGSFGATFQVKIVQPDLLLLDVNMPGFSGADLADLILILFKGKNIPIIFYSSNDEESLRELMATHGVQDYICKGDIAALRNKVNEFLAGETRASAFSVALPLEHIEKQGVTCNGDL